MSIDHWQTITRLFEQAVDLPESERATFLDSACGGDADLRREVASLLAHDRGDTQLGEAVGSAALSIESTRMVGQRVGAYRVVSLIGHGGMGSVYLAERDDGEFHHSVAIKLMRPDYGPAVERFHHERQILARLTHPYIARLLDGGTTDDGHPYFVMEYVAGTPIHEYCRNLPIRKRIDLFRMVCEAVQYAHQNLTVHRDIKPANVLVTPAGTPKLLDFGIAKVIEDGVESMGTTVTHGVALTPDYASPEQVRGQAITTATDVYGLGALLYTLLSGQRPYEFLNSAPGEIERVVCTEEVRRLGDRAPELRGDLEAIVMKAMRKDPTERYRSVEQLSDDLGRYLDGAPVEARRNLFAYRAIKFVRRNRLLVTASVITALALALGTGVAIWQARRAERRFEQVRGLAHSFLFDIESSLGKVPGSTKTRQMIVQTALTYIENLAQDAHGDVGLQRELASAYEKIGEIQGSTTSPNLGDTKASAVSFRKAQDLRRAFGAHVSKDPAIRREYLYGQLQVIEALQRLNQLPDAVDLTRQLASDSDALVHDHPTDLECLRLASTAHTMVGTLDMRTGDLKHSLDERTRALELSRRIAAIRGNDDESRRAIAKALMGLGMTLDRTNARAEAEKAYLEAMAIYRDFSTRDPEDQTPRHFVMILAALAGSAARAQGQGHYDQSYTLQKESFTIAEAALEADPSNAQALMDDLAVCQRFGDLLYDMKKRQEATRLFDRALASSEKLVKLDPANREARLNYGLAMARVALMAKDRGDIKSALAWRQKAGGLYEELAAEAPLDTKVGIPRMHNFMMIGEWLDESGDRVTAETYYRKALTLGEKILAADPLEKEMADRVTKIHARLGIKPKPVTK